MRKLRNALVLLAVLALVAVALLPEAQLVDSGATDRGTVRETLEAEGRTRVRERYEIAAPVAAQVRRLTLEPGDTVETGQVLAVLDALPAPALDARARAEAEERVKAAQARWLSAGEERGAAQVELAQAQSEAARAAQLASERQLPVEAAERAQTAHLRFEREVAAARAREAGALHELEAAKAVLDFDSRAEGERSVLELRAPAGGVLLRRHYESARPVQAGQVLLEIGDPAALEVEVDVLSADAVRLAEGMAAELLRWGREPALLARVRRVEPGGFTKFSALGVEEQRVWVILDLVDPPEDARRLGDAYRVHARFLLREARDVLRAPASAVFRHADGHAVFRIEGERARRTPVELGLVGGGLAEIRAGLSEDQRLILHPDRDLEHGARVRER